MDQKSTLLRILLHGFFLVSVNLFSVMVAFAIVVFFSWGDGEITHAASALILNLIVYITIFGLMHGIESAIMKVDNWSMLMAILMISLAMLPCVYYPVYYFTQGGWSTFNNLMNIWPYQFIVNAICLAINYFLLDNKKIS